MSFYDFINRILGIHGRRQDSLPAPREDDRTFRPRSDEFRSPFWNWDDDDDEEEDEDGFGNRPSSTPFGFRIFSDPIEIHKFFEHQMEEMMRNFSMFDTPAIYGEEMPPQAPQGPQNKGSLRDQYLKPGFESPKQSWPFSKKKEDSDIDDRISSGDLDTILGDKPSLESEEPQRSLVPAVPRIQTKLFGKSVTSKTIRNPDGSVETHRTVRDSQGNEETTVTRQMGDQSYTLTIHTDATGAEQRTENFYNMQEGDLEDFNKRFGRQQPKDVSITSKPHNWFPFDKFFK